MEIFSRPPTEKGPAATFTGEVWVDGIYAGPSREQAADGSDEPQTTWGEAVTDSGYRAPRTPAR